MAKSFNILAPISNPDDVELFKEAGADELYCGYLTKDLTRRWPAAFNVLNRRGEGHSLEDAVLFRQVCRKAYSFRMPLYVTVNGIYTPEQYPYLSKFIEELESLPGVTGIIVGDLGLLIYLKGAGFSKRVHISTAASVFNSNTADFYSQLGAHRVVLERQFTCNEINDFVTNLRSGIETEIFILAEGCGGFIDGLCTFYNCMEKIKDHPVQENVIERFSYIPGQTLKGCKYYFHRLMKKKLYKVFDPSTNKEIKLNRKFQEDKNNLFGCRLCDLYDLKSLPIASLKIPGRNHASEDILRRICLLSDILVLLNDPKIDKVSYQKECKNMFFNVIGQGKKKCSKFDCYFSTHWVNDEKRV